MGGPFSFLANLFRCESSDLTHSRFVAAPLVTTQSLRTSRWTFLLLNSLNCKFRAVFDSDAVGSTSPPRASPLVLWPLNDMDSVRATNPVEQFPLLAQSGHPDT